MKKYHQQQIIDVLQTIKEAQSVKLYADCQDAALSLCDFIDDVKGSGSQTVVLLEKYCELLFKVNSGEVGEKILRKHFVKIENSVTHELKPSRIEIVFLSYKASMSDSLETIYLAAKDDPSCDAYWIPIPYYDRKNDGSFGEMHYEGVDFYPPHFDVVDWESYDIEKRRPDVVFTFNGYDSINVVTSVEPNFYCEKLHALTDMLVYVPYYVTAGEKSVEYLCTIPGCIYAHRVFLQSESVKSCFVEKFEETYGDNFGKPKEKFIALGSPKFDKVVKSKKEYFRLPAEWQSLIGQKKVVFFNSTIAAVLKGNKAYLEKIQYVHDVFRTRDDVVLWWRPHPLNESTYESMRPRLLDEYLGIIAEYKRGCWGIYDDTPDLHRAIAWADAYYGDSSSLVPMFNAVGVPLMIGDISTLNANEEATLFDENEAISSSIHMRDGCIWFSSKTLNVFFRAAVTDGTTRIAGHFPEVGYATRSDKFLYGEFYESNNSFYFAPYCGKSILMYSLIDGTFDTIPFEVDSAGKSFYWGTAHGSYVFFSPYNYPAIMCLNSETREVTYYTDWVDSVNEFSNSDEDFYLGKPCTVGNMLWFCSGRANVVVAFDMVSCTSLVYEVGDKSYRYSGICFDGENLWLSPRVNTVPIVKWNPDKGIIREFTELVYKAETLELSTCGIVYSLGHCWLFPLEAEHVYKIDVNTDVISTMQEFELDCIEATEKLSRFKFFRVQKYESCIYIYKFRSGVITLIIYNCITHERKDVVVRVSNTIINQLELLYTGVFSLSRETVNVEADCYYYEGGMISLKHYLDYVVNHAGDSELKSIRRSTVQSFNTNADGKAGSEIYNYVKNVII